MITTAGKAKQKPCIMKLDRWNGNCGACECLGWEFFLAPAELMGENKLHGNPKHGKRDTDKLGFCGRARSR
jgi:hypothetical protein